MPGKLKSPHFKVEVPHTSSTSLGGSRWPDPGVLIKYLRYHGNQISGQDICFSRKEGWKTGKTWHIIKRLADLFEPIGISLHLFPDFWYFYRHLLYIYIVFGLQILWSINYYNVGNRLDWDWGPMLSGGSVKITAASQHSQIGNNHLKGTQYCRKSIHRFHNRLYNHGEGPY